MMQQTVCQPDQLASQQSMTQQMVLCPVKLVYDTQILVQPGDQIQPNQTIFINPHNPPPWIQNRMQSQVIYVQQVPNNVISNYQQQIDPNSIYIQNYPYQIHQQILTQSPQEQKPTQMASLPTNMIQSMPTVHNVATIQDTVQNERQTQVNNFQITQQMANRQLAPNIAFSQVNNPMHQQPIEIRQIMNIRPQMALNTNIRQPQVSANVSNTQQNIRSTLTPETNQHCPIRIQNNTVNVQHIMQPDFKNSEYVQTPTKVLNSVTTEMSPNNRPAATDVSNLKSVPNYAYRPIQPRPQYRHNVPNIGVLTQPLAQTQNIQNNSNIRPKDNSVTSAPIPNITTNITNMDNQAETPINRKRKSESPDERKIKISVPNHVVPNHAVRNHVVPTNNIPNRRTITFKNVVMPKEISVLLSDDKGLKSHTALPPVNNSAQIIKLVNNGQQTNLTNNPVTKPTSSQTTPNDKDKLVRNTVFTQARGRLLNDKEIVPNAVNLIDVKTMKSPDKDESKVENKVAEVKIGIKTGKLEVISSNNNLRAIKVQRNELNKLGVKSESTVLAKQVQLKNEVNSTQKILTHVKTIKSPDKDASKVENKAPEIKTDGKTRTFEVISANNNLGAIKVQQNELNKFGVKSESTVLAKQVQLKNEVNATQQILTHVLDGYVIQESNIAFPTRRPLQEKIIYENTKTESAETKDLKEEAAERLKEDTVKENKPTDLQQLPFHCLQIESKVDNVKTKLNEGNPFSSLHPDTVKSWTVDQLAKHLTRYGWSDTVSTLREHEIDGESLFLVSKTQLVHIGVSEEHADVVCEFVNP